MDVDTGAVRGSHPPGPAFGFGSHPETPYTSASSATQFDIFFRCRGLFDRAERISDGVSDGISVIDEVDIGAVKLDCVASTLVEATESVLLQELSIFRGAEMGGLTDADSRLISLNGCQPQHHTIIVTIKILWDRDV